MDDTTVPEASSSTTTTNPPTDAAPPLSKNAQKKLLKAARLADLKKERRAAEKDRRKQKKRERAEQEKYEGVDLGFDELMSENEVKSLTSQLAFTYSANRKAICPFSSLLFTSLNGRTFTRLEGMSDAAYSRWIDTEWWEDDYQRLWKGSEETEAVQTNGETSEPKEDATDATNAKKAPKQKKLQTAPRENIVYLTADSSEELTELKEDETYIIGGICDHNRYKNLCLKKSEDTNIRSARLPISTYLAELKTRKVLTVNQTFEILLKWVETRDWEQALQAVVPKRKFEDKGGGHDAEGESKVVFGAAEVEEGRREDDEDDSKAPETIEIDVSIADEPSMSTGSQGNVLDASS
ncbi:hypothetical protein EUX98_g2293 [Antrodiella citrinella]|uniref:tRNA (guanine(9)-N1)-methyltransferase n=1 Tax=Antrodiella citrinella TaxID=2447956 RepID=A0A4V3XJ64_9APHY|nr:hypothetical protein EUX98_g2293 [Antrodiella citrinella]